jgi:hypothetical protein
MGRPFREQVHREITVELDVRKADIAVWQQIFSDGFQSPFQNAGDPNFQDIALFDYLLSELESIEEYSEEAGKITLTLPQLQRLVSVIDTSKMQYRSEANFELYRATEACEKALLDLAAPYRKQIEALSDTIGVAR